MNNSVIRSRIDPVVKKEANKVFNAIGLTMSEAIRLFLNQVVVKQSMPFPLDTPNSLTIKAMENTNNGIDLEEVTLGQLKQDWQNACEK